MSTYREKVASAASYRESAFSFPERARRLKNGAANFNRDENGSVAIIFALSAFIITSLVGGAVDYGRATTARAQMQNTLDAAALASARVWQVSGDMHAAQTAAENYYNNNRPRWLESSTMTFHSDSANNKITLDATGDLVAPFLSAAKSIGNTMSGKPAGKYVYTVEAASQATLAVGGNAETNLEVSLMLDVTGSMGGQKIQDLKDSAKDLVDILVWDDQSEYSARVALAPFADRINVGQYASAMTGLPATRTVSTTTGKGKKQVTTTSTEYLKQCVTDRWGVAQFKDDAPDRKNYEMSPYDGRPNASEADQYQANNGNCARPTAEIMPLTNDKQALKDRIDSMTAGGMTAGALGTQMAWYLLSPNWGNVWPSQSKPVAYGTAKTQKIAVLMTDGEYNFHRGQNWNSSSVGAFAKNTCRGMKDEGITVYTIGFQLPARGQSRDVLMDCASDSTKFYEASDGVALRAAFRDIALQLAKLRLTQ
ncbi:MAG: pilus assembly protein TadG-related protein [Hyphomicrobiaceae bacterium]